MKQKLAYTKLLLEFAFHAIYTVWIAKKPRVSWYREWSTVTMSVTVLDPTYQEMEGDEEDA